MVAAVATLFHLSHRLPTGSAVPKRFLSSSNLPATPDGPEQGAVNVAATVLWSEPVQLREYDKLILQEKNDPAAWTGGMDPAMRLWLVDKAETMALYGEPVVILERRGDWLKIAATAQKTTLNEHGYPGWVPVTHIAKSELYLSELKSRPSVVVSKKVSRLYSNPELSEKVGEVSYMTKLPLLEDKEQTVTVRLPGGNTGYLARNDIKKTQELVFSRSGIVDEARQFLGVPYLWAGTGAYGFDCSGFVMRLYQSQGISIPRDANEQAKAGSEVTRQELLPGDLVFYAAKGGLGQIHHVGMYVGGGMMIHSPNSSSSVRIEAVDSGTYGEEYWGAKRFEKSN